MHLSVVTNFRSSNSLGNTKSAPPRPISAAYGDPHVQGLVRGLLFGGIMAILALLTASSQWWHPADVATPWPDKGAVSNGR